MPDTTRTFVAIVIPEVLGRKLARLQETLAPTVTGIRWAAPEPFHLTLAFLGDVRNADLSAVCRSVADASAGFEPLDLRIEGLGAFPDAVRPRVVWAGLTGAGLEALAALQKNV